MQQLICYFLNSKLMMIDEDLNAIECRTLDHALHLGQEALNFEIQRSVQPSDGMTS